MNRTLEDKIRNILEDEDWIKSIIDSISTPRQDEDLPEFSFFGPAAQYIDPMPIDPMPIDPMPIVDLDVNGKAFSIHIGGEEVGSGFLGDKEKIITFVEDDDGVKCAKIKKLEVKEPSTLEKSLYRVAARKIANIIVMMLIKGMKGNESSAFVNFTTSPYGRASVMLMIGHLLPKLMPQSIKVEKVLEECRVEAISLIAEGTIDYFYKDLTLDSKRPKVRIKGMKNLQPLEVAEEEESFLIEKRERC